MELCDIERKRKEISLFHSKSQHIIIFQLDPSMQCKICAFERQIGPSKDTGQYICATIKKKLGPD